jgi:hypothetical protein
MNRLFRGAPQTVLAIFLLALLLAPTAARAQAPDPWPAGGRVSTEGESAFEPRLAFDDEGFAHLAFFGGGSQDAWSIFYTNNRAGSFAPPRLISVPRGNQQLGEIAVGADGHVHVVYQRGADNEIYHVESPDYGESWGAPFNVSRSPGRAFEPTLAVDAAGGVHVAWVDTRWTGIVGLSYATRPPGGGFGAPQRIGLPQFESAPAMVATGAGASLRLHIVYQGRIAESNDNGDFEVYYLTYAGGRFSAPRDLSRDRNVWSLTPSIAVDAAGALYLAWDRDVAGQHDVVLSRSLDAGASWSEPVNVAQTPLASLFPRLAAGVDRAGRRQLHIVWSEEGVVGGRRVLYRRFDPDAGSYTDVQQVSSLPESSGADVGASAANEQYAVGYQARAGTSQVLVSAKGFGAVVSARLRINGGAASTTSRALSVTLENLLGGATRMRYALGRAPGAGEPWQPLQTAFTLEIPRDGQCVYTLYVQLDAPDGRSSKALPATIAVDSEVQAAIGIHNPYYDGRNSDPDYSNRPAYTVGVANAGECNQLTILLAAGSAQPFAIDNAGFRNTFVLPGPLSDGPRPVTVRVEDSVGNRRSVTRQLVLDTRAPKLISGTLAVQGRDGAVPAAGLASPDALLRVTGLEARDNLYPGGFWGLLVANVADPSRADDDPSLVWRAVRLEVEENNATTALWRVTDGLVVGPGDRRLAGETIEVRARVIDGAGNASAEVLRASVRLAEDYRVGGVWVPLVVR